MKTNNAVERVVMARALALVFARQLAAVLSAEDFAEVCKRNRVAESGVCHSHDFCDANMVMARAFLVVTGMAVDTQRDEDCVLWSQAWRIAMAKGLDALCGSVHEVEGEGVKRAAIWLSKTGRVRSCVICPDVAAVVRAAAEAYGPRSTFRRTAASVPPGAESIVHEVAAQDESEIARAHHALSEALENPDAGNDEVRDAAVDVCDALNALQSRAQSSLAIVEAVAWSAEPLALLTAEARKLVPECPARFGGAAQQAAFESRGV